MTRRYNWKATLEGSLQVNWQVADLIGGDRKPDFARPFLPEPFARTVPLTFLDADERRTLSQIRGRGYLHMCGLFDSFILSFVLDNARRLLNGDGWRVRALLQFAAEEAKHIELFEQFRRAFDRGFGSSCRAIGPVEEIGRTVMAHDPLAVALITLMIESMLQAHYAETIASDSTIDPLFRNLVRAHCQEEAYHTDIDTAMIEALAAGRDSAALGRAVDDFFAIAAMLDAGLAQQAEYDLAAFERATGRVLSEAEGKDFRRVQHYALRWTFLWSGMRHPDFVVALDRLGEETRLRITDAAPALC